MTQYGVAIFDRLFVKSRRHLSEAHLMMLNTTRVRLRVLSLHVYTCVHMYTRV